MSRKQTTQELQRPKELVLLVEDDDDIRFLYRELIADHGWKTVEAANCADAERAAEKERPSLAVLDHHLPDGTGLELLQRLRDRDPTVAVVILTAHHSIEFAVEAMRAGADHFLTKPVDSDTLLSVAERCLAERRERRRQRAYEHRDRHRPDPFRGSSKAIRQFEKRVRKMADSEGTVLLLGETGCGKGVLARWIHDHGPRSEEPFVEINCAGLKSDFLESELFGYRKGAFTGASEAKPGLLEVADRGTLFLDELAEMDLGIQAKLLKVLEEQTFRPLGDVKDRKVDIRLIGATQRDLLRRVQTGEFRTDLYYRLHTLYLDIPSLRERSEDIPFLVERILPEICRKVGRPVPEISPRSLDLMCRYDWPGNIRELRNVLERAVLLHEGSTLEIEDLELDEISGELIIEPPPETVTIQTFPVRFTGRPPIEAAPAVPPEDPPVEAPEIEEPKNESSPADVPADDEPWEDLRNALREQVVAANDRASRAPIARWLADDLLLCAQQSVPGGLRSAAARIGVPKSTFARKIRGIDPEDHRPDRWDDVRGLLPKILDLHAHENGNLLQDARDLLLEEVRRSGPEDALGQAALMDVSPATLRTWKKSSS